MRRHVQSLASLHGLSIWHCQSCGVGHKCGSDPICCGYDSNLTPSLGTSIWQKCTLKSKKNLKILVIEVQGTEWHQILKLLKDPRDQSDAAEIKPCEDEWGAQSDTATRREKLSPRYRKTTAEHAPVWVQTVLFKGEQETSYWHSDLCHKRTKCDSQPLDISETPLWFWQVCDLHIRALTPHI